MQNISLNLHRLFLYRQVKKDEIICKVQELIRILNCTDHIDKMYLENCYCEFMHDLVHHAHKLYWDGDLWKNYVLSLILEDENVFSLSAEKNKREISSSIYNLAVKDMSILKELYWLDWDDISRQIDMENPINDFQTVSMCANSFRAYYIDKVKYLKNYFSFDVSPQLLTEQLADFYYATGCGKIGKYAAFRWNNGLQEISDPDPVKLEDLIGYEYQKEVLLTNTAAFVNGKKANHVLLYGEKGTGKSSTVKALLNAYANQGLRMIELTKSQLVDFPRVMQILRNRRQRFIIFIDDLSFEDFEVEYKYIKASIEGSLEISPDNVLLYVTSNRKHLIKENFNDRKSTGDEVHVADSYQEKLSFADRFGITITYQSPDQDQYLQIVLELAKKHGLDIPAETLIRKAIQWEMKYNGRSGRTAQQFIIHLTACGC